MFWIPVRGNPPPVERYVLTWQPHGVPKIAMITLGPTVRMQWYTQAGYMSDPPTHWMPIPEPPKGKGEA